MHVDWGEPEHPRPPVSGMTSTHKGRGGQEEEVVEKHFPIPHSLQLGFLPSLMLLICRRMNQSGTMGWVHGRFWDENANPHGRSNIKYV